MPFPFATLTVIGLVLGIMGQIESGFFMANAVKDMDGPAKPPMPNMGEPWTVWIQTGFDGSTNPGINVTDPLKDAGGPFPAIYLFNDQGEYLGRPWAKNKYGRSNTVGEISVYPNKGPTGEGQDATIAILSARDGGRDGHLIAELAWGFADKKQFRNGPYGINGHTFVTCGAPWYPSGISRPLKEGGMAPLPGFWLGGQHGLGAIQVHGPYHTYGTSKFDFDKYKPGSKARSEAFVREFCQHPARLSFYLDPIPERDIKTTVVKDFELFEDRTRAVTKGSRRYPDYHGAAGASSSNGTSNDDPNRGSSNIFARSSESKQEPSTVPSSHRLLTVADNESDTSAKLLCQSPSSFGPDYVNIREGFFCRMEDRKLFPLCQQPGNHGETNDNKDDKILSQDGDCFDLETKQIGYGWSSARQSGRVQRNQARRFARSSQVVYDGELRSAGDGWEFRGYP